MKDQNLLLAYTQCLNSVLHAQDFLNCYVSLEDIETLSTLYFTDSFRCRIVQVALGHFEFDEDIYTIDDFKTDCKAYINPAIETLLHLNHVSIKTTLENADEWDSTDPAKCSYYDLFECVRLTINGYTDFMHAVNNYIANYTKKEVI